MPIRCTFELNNRKTSYLYCAGIGQIEAFSGHGQGRDNPNNTDEEDVGAIPKGTYYLIDRESGGHLGMLYDLWDEYGFGTTDRTKWFALWNPLTGDTTIINGHKRGNFRLHPMGRMRLSEGCITVVSPARFDQLARYLRSRKPDMPVPGSSAMAYGIVEVR
ncbi:hypothetical protein P3T40_007181 [Paraburkholderia sp. EB58]|jgi:hypothetical protein|uniref:DUF2778 domain-containing protein n=1 Tax=Paraburkholderia sp. EB58 TaxID=3035125 RepID=UPI003D21E278